jgi:hypothetical protein
MNEYQSVEALLLRALADLEEARTRQAAELEDPNITLAAVIKMKKAAEKTLRAAQAFTLETERELGRALKGLEARAAKKAQDEEK